MNWDDLNLAGISFLLSNDPIVLISADRDISNDDKATSRSISKHIHGRVDLRESGIKEIDWKLIFALGREGDLVQADSLLTSKYIEDATFEGLGLDLRHNDCRKIAAVRFFELYCPQETIYNNSRKRCMAHNLFQRYQFFCEARGAVKLITGWPEVFGELIDMAKDLEKLGVQTPLKLTECFTGMTLTRRHLQLLSSDLDGSGPWEKNLSFGHFASAAVKWSVSITEILTMARDLEAFGVKIPLLPENCPEVALTKRHLELLSRDLDGRKPWAKEISAVKCAMASILWSIPIADVFQMAQDLGGFRIQIEHQGKNLAKIELTEQECKLLSYELTGKPPYLFDLPFDQCARAALTWSVSMDEILSVAKALKDKGVSVPYLSEKDNRTPVSKRHLDLLLLDYSDLGELPVAIGLGQCVKASIEWSIRISDVLEMAQDLDGFGVEVPRLPKDLPETTFTRQHVQLLSRDLDGEPPWASEVSIAQCARAAAKWSMPFTDVISLAQDLAPFMVLTPSLAVNWSVDELSILEKLYAARRIAPFSSSDFLSGIDLGLFVAESDTSVTDIASLLARMTEANCPVDEALDLARFIIAEE